MRSRLRLHNETLSQNANNVYYIYLHSALNVKSLKNKKIEVFFKNKLVEAVNLNNLSRGIHNSKHKCTKHQDTQFHKNKHNWI